MTQGCQSRRGCLYAGTRLLQEEIAEVEAEAVKFLQEVEAMFDELSKVEML
jgi:hypothetical protein